MREKLRSLRRLAGVAGWFALAACGATDCGGCLAPLDAPFPEARKFNGAGQVRLTPSGVNFLESNLPTIIQSFASIPCDASLPADQRVPCPGSATCVGGDHCEQGGQRLPLIGFRVPYIYDEDSCEMRICESPSGNQCLVYVEMQSVSLAPGTPAKLDVTLGTRIWSTDLPISRELDWSPACWISADCLYRVTDRQRAVAVPVTLRTDNPLQRLEIEVGQPDIPLDSDDLAIDGHLGCDIIDWIMPALFPLIRGALRDALNNTVKDAVIDMTVESCQAPAQCTDAVATTCDGDRRCHYASGGRFVPVLLGIEGGLDLASLLGAFAGQAAEVIGVSLAAGGYAEVVADGIEIGMRGGTDVQPSLCVPPMDTPLPLPPRLNFGNSVPHPVTGASVPFMTGIAVSDRLLDEVLRGAVQSGILCQRIDSGLSSYINTGALGLLASSLGNLTRGGAKPALIEILPRDPIRVDVGLGTTAVDPNDPGRTILDRPLLTLHAHDLDLDLYGMVDDRYVRFMTMRANLRIGIGLEDDGQGNLLVLVSGIEDWIQDVEVLNSEILTDAPEDIATAVPSLIGAMLGQFAPELTQSIALPDLAGFALEDLTIRGVQQRVDGGTPVVDALGHDVFEFMGLFANLSFDPAATGSPLRYAVDTVASVRRLEVPPAEAFDVAFPGGPQRPVVELDVAAAHHDGDDVEFSHRVDGGFWRPFHRGRVLSVTDPLLQLMGRHRIEVRGRRVGAPSTLDPSPVELEVLIDPLAPALEVEPVRARSALVLHAEDAVTPAAALQVRVLVDGAPVHTQLGLAAVALAPDLLDGHRLDVEVLDEAGNTARWSHGVAPAPPVTPTTEVAVPATTAPDLDAADGGCGCGMGPRHESPRLALLLVVALVWSRRRARAARR